MGPKSIAPATPKKSKSSLSSSPKKAKSPKSPGIQERRKEWKASLRPWAPQRGFTHPDGMKTMTKTDAKKNFKLDDYDIGSLPCEILRRPPLIAVQLYAYDQLMELAKGKCAKLGIPLVVGGLVYHSHSGSSQSGSVSVVSFQYPQKLKDWQEHVLHPDPPPLKIHEYTCPYTAVKPDPEKITWTPSKLSGSVAVADACRLYCVNPADIEDLRQHSQWIDLATVARRAVTLHGGFYAHEEFVRQRRNEEKEMLTRTITAAYNRKSNFRFSPMIQKQWDAPNDDDYLYETSNSPRPDRVAVLYPIIYYCDDDYGCDWKWAPWWGDF
ncbi:hypothetical protein DFH09DRAFT_170236 [Mycena vulgaris]|nr:hypothetical protein DFH09DRAFT_170236 [Mycena vulgaris]